MSQRTVWITGLGAATPLGNGLDDFSRNLLASKSATEVIVDDNGATQLRSPGSRIELIPVPAGCDEATFRALPRIEQLAHFCCAAALAEVGCPTKHFPQRIGLVLGVGGEWLHHWEMNSHSGGSQLYDGGEPTSLVKRTQSRLGIAGPTITLGAACASGNYAIAQARRWIQLGIVDICLAGALEVTTPICRAGFNNLRALSRNVENAATASRPFDRDRSGFTMGEGGAIFVLEAADAARARGAKPYAEVAGFGASSDAFHMIIPSSDFAPAASAMRAALTDAGVEPHEIDYINAHATSTPVGDKAEAAALHAVFGEHTKSTPVSSTKSMTGHMLSAAAAVEAVACIAAIERQTLPATINLDNPDPDCDLCHVRGTSQPSAVEVVLSNSFGFGGSNTSLVLRRAS